MVECREFVAREHARSVLDVGCGVGRWSIVLGKAGLTVKGSEEKLSRTDNPTKGVTLILYDDDELREAFVGFEVIDLRRYEMGTRGLYLRKLTRQRTRAST